MEERTDIIKMSLKEVRRYLLDWINLSQDSVRWKAHLKQGNEP
jgi:hypothetical protein